MDHFEELENMATNVADECGVEFEPDEDEIARWQRIFAYSYSEALEQVTNQKNDYSRCKVSDDHWDLVKSQKKAQGYSRQAYEHEIKTGGRSTTSHDQRVTTGISASQASATYLILLECVLSTPEKIQAAARSPEPPQTVQASSETGDSVFCRIDEVHVQAHLRPPIKSEERSYNDINTSDTRNRVDSSPAPIFLLADILLAASGRISCMVLFLRAFLTRLLSLPETEHPLLVPANISRGIIKTWQDKYNALVDGASADCVHGLAHRVTTKEREEALLLYETEKYEINIADALASFTSLPAISPQSMKSTPYIRMTTPVMSDKKSRNGQDGTNGLSSQRQQVLQPWSTEAVNIVAWPVVYTCALIEIGILGGAL
ncbi:MAG: hypothetical protein Q9175_002705 [Cornicularia normoerica]